MNDRCAIDLYAQFLAHYAQGESSSDRSGFHLVRRANHDGSMIPFKESAADFLHELFNPAGKRKVFLPGPFCGLPIADRNDRDEC